LLDNYICYCDYNKETGEYDWNGGNIVPKGELTRYSGILEKNIRKYDNFIEAVIRAIDKKVPIIAGVDVFYAAHRGAEREKKHWPHYILIYGYNRDNGTFTVLEHMYMNSSVYKEMEVEFPVILECHHSFLEYYPEYDALIEVRKTAASPESFYTSRSQYLYSSERRASSIENYAVMAQDIIDILQAEYCDETVKRTLNSLMKAKTYSEFFAQKAEYQKRPAAVIERSRKVAYAYAFIWGIFLKYSFQKDKVTAIEKIKERVETILLYGKSVWGYEVEKE
jgi:hypothetical protein